MDIFIYGTKGGARLFYQTSQGQASVFDDCRGFGGYEPIGQAAYSIEYTKNGVAFTKWLIVDDVDRDSIGFIAFAVEVNEGKKLKGAQVVYLLDQLAKKYQEKYLNQHFELNNPRENWTFVDDLKKAFVVKVETPEFTNSSSRGERNGAYIYYSPNELVQFFNAPYQPDYADYKQVFFVNQKYKGQDNNPLNALRHSKEADLTDKKILENLSYRVVIPGIKEKISTRVSVNNQNVEHHAKIHPRSSIQISFSRKNYHDKTIQGTLNELKTKYPVCVTVDDSNLKLTINPPHKLDPKTKTITFSIKKWDGKSITGADITLKSSGYSGQSKKVENNKVTFEEGELGQPWRVTVRKERFEEATEAFTPAEAQRDVSVELHKKKTVSFNVSDGVDRVFDYKIKIKGKDQSYKNDKVTFMDGEIYKLQTVCVHTKQQKVGEESFTPSEKGNTLTIHIDRFKINEGEHGKIKKEFIDKWFYSKDAVKKNMIKPEKGYNVKGFKKQGNKLFVQYEEKPPFYKNNAFWGVNSKISIVKGELKNSIHPRPKVGNEDWLMFFLNLFSSSSDNGNDNANKNKNWRSLLKRLQKEDTILAFAKQGEIDSLKICIFGYLDQQTACDNAVNKLDNNYQDKLAKIMKTDEISKMTLGEIVLFLNNFQEILKIEAKVKSDENKDKEWWKRQKDNIESLKLKPKDYLPAANQKRDKVLKLIKDRIESLEGKSPKKEKKNQDNNSLELSQDNKREERRKESQKQKSKPPKKVDNNRQSASSKKRSKAKKPHSAPAPDNETSASNQSPSGPF